MTIINKIALALVFLLLLFGVHSNAQIYAGKNFDLQGFIDKELAAGKKEIQIPPGRHRVEPKGNRHILLKDLQDVTILANDAELICTETVQAINIINCKNLTIRGLAVDYDPLPYTQGRIVTMSEDKNTLTVELIDGYPLNNLRNTKMEIYSPNTGQLVTRTYYSVTFKVDEAKNRVTFF